MDIIRGGSRILHKGTNPLERAHIRFYRMKFKEFWSLGGRGRTGSPLDQPIIMNKNVCLPVKRFLFLGVRRGLDLFKKSSTSKLSKSCCLFNSEAHVSWSSMFSELPCSMLSCVSFRLRRSPLYGVVPAYRTLHP